MRARARSILRIEREREFFHDKRASEKKKKSFPSGTFLFLFFFSLS
jgi:hypothetical protein